MSIRIINNLSAENADAQEQIAHDTGATSVQRVPEADGQFTLIIVYPDYETYADLAARLEPARPADA